MPYPGRQKVLVEGLERRQWTAIDGDSATGGQEVPGSNPGSPTRREQVRGGVLDLAPHRIVISLWSAGKGNPRPNSVVGAVPAAMVVVPIAIAVTVAAVVAVMSVVIATAVDITVVVGISATAAMAVIVAVMSVVIATAVDITVVVGVGVMAATGGNRRRGSGRIGG